MFYDHLIQSFSCFDHLFCNEFDFSCLTTNTTLDKWLMDKYFTARKNKSLPFCSTHKEDTSHTCSHTYTYCLYITGNKLHCIIDSHTSSNTSTRRVYIHDDVFVRVFLFKIEELCDNIALINQSRKILDGPVKQIRRAYSTNTYRVVFKGNALGFTNALWTGAEVIEKHTEDDQHHFTIRLLNGVSSSQLLQAGDFGRAGDLLGRPYAISGRVVRGRQLGRTLGFPTANLRFPRTPALSGIYATWVHGVFDQPWPSVSSFGTRPTVEGVEPLLEAHLFDFQGDLYGRHIEVEFVAKLRDEEKFNDLAALTDQMHRDAEQARALLSEHRLRATA